MDLTRPSCWRPCVACLSEPAIVFLAPFAVLGVFALNAICELSL